MEEKRLPAKSFEDLIVWQKAHQFVLAIYKLSDAFPKSELFGLTSQLRRAAVSVPANIAEGFKKKSKAEKLRYLGISDGSLEECRYYLVLIKDLDYADTLIFKAQLEEVSKLLRSYAQTILNN